MDEHLLGIVPPNPRGSRINPHHRALADIKRLSVHLHLSAAVDEEINLLVFLVCVVDRPNLTRLNGFNGNFSAGQSAMFLEEKFPGDFSQAGQFHGMVDPIGEAAGFKGAKGFGFRFMKVGWKICPYPG